jgi:transcriptional regulator with GAF, ATPase, and Fis domain
LIESELFGHERGAFTGAAGLRRGRFETAEQGTIYLDEIGELSLHLQAKLLRVLEDRIFERVGGSATLRLHARIIAATNRKLIEGVRARTFRPDLYFRLNVLSIEVPSLRERAVDVPLLVHAGLQRVCEQHGVSVPHVSDAVHERLSRHTWPGNVRELLNLLERLAIEQRDALSDPEELEEFLRTVSIDALEDGSLDVTQTELEPEDLREKERIIAALKEFGGNLSRTARRLELPRSTLRHRITRYALGYLIPKD